MSNKQKYIELCKSEPSIPLFSKSWWLDSVTDNWDVALVIRNNRIVASLPYCLSHKYGKYKYITLPLLTQSIGIWIEYPENQKYTSKLSYEKEIINELINQLPDFDYFNQNFHYSFSNFLPFHWNGYTQTSRMTYLINDLSDVDNIFNNFEGRIRKEIRKAEKTINVDFDDNIELFYELNNQVFKKQGLAIPYTFEFIKKLDRNLSTNKSRRIFFAKDISNNIHAALYLVWDSNSAYYLMGGTNLDYRTSGAMSLLMWEAIKYASTVTTKFDFEGSMIEPIENFFKGFGAVQQQYTNISKINSKSILLLNTLAQFKKLLIAKK
ncbi:MAG: GNAT family N-acetyltransferase [bacterium]